MSDNTSTVTCKREQSCLFYEFCDCPKCHKTVGEAAIELQQQPQYPQSVLETQKEMLKGYIDQLILAAQRGQQELGKSKPFYLCVQSRRERLLRNVVRNQFYYRQTRPIPQYDLALYYYNPTEENITFIWCIPDKETVTDIALQNFQGPPEQQELIHFVKSFLHGTLV